MQLQESHNVKEAIAQRLAKKSAQLDLAHTAVNDMQNKMNYFAAQQRSVKNELQGQIREKTSQVTDVDNKYKQKYGQLKLLV